MNEHQPVIAIAGALVMILGGSVLVWRSGRRRRVEQLAGQWDQFMAHFRQLPAGWSLIEVVRSHQVARRGTKCIVAWPLPGETVDGDMVLAGSRYDTWVPIVTGARPRPGEHLIVLGSFGYGPHSQRDIFYVAQLRDRAPRAAYDAWLRHARRSAR